MHDPASDSNSPSRVRAWLSLWLAAAAASAYLCRQCLAVVEKSVREELLISEEAMGFIMGPAFFWSYALMQIPGGWAGQRYGSRLVIPLLAVTWSLGTAAWGLATGTALLLAGRLAVGVAQAGLFPCSANTISHWYPPSERARASGALGAAMQVGAAVASFLTAWLLQYLDWQSIFVLFAVPGLLWAFGFGAWFRNDPAGHRAVNESELALIRQGRNTAAHTPDAPQKSVDWWNLATSPAMWMICLQQFFRAAGYVWFGSWFATYLQETRGISQEKSGWLLAIPLTAAFVASLMSGSLSDWVFARTGNLSLARRGLAAGSLLVCGVLVFASYFIEDATAATGVIAAGVFCASFAGPCAYAVTIDMGGDHVAPVFSTMNMIGNFGAGLLAWAVPYFRTAVDSNSTLLSLSGGNSWNAVLVLFSSMYLLAAVFWLLLRVEGTVFDRPAGKKSAT